VRAVLGPCSPFIGLRRLLLILQLDEEQTRVFNAPSLRRAGCGRVASLSELDAYSAEGAAGAGLLLQGLTHVESFFERL
jgi:hypothetical protein